jgi:serine protease
MRWAAGLSVTGIPLNPNPAKVISISFGGNAACNAAYQDVIDELARHDVVVVAAAGNEHGNVTRPASCARVVGVAALNRDGFKATYSNFGPQLAIATVGGDPGGSGAWAGIADDGMLTVSNGGVQSPGPPSYAYVSGTSFAVPVTAGVVGLMLSVAPGGLTVEQVRDGLARSARPHVTSTRMGVCSWNNPGRCICTTATCGAGILDADEAVRFALDPAGYQAPVRSAAVIDSPELAQAVAGGQDRPANPATSSRSGGGAFDFGWLALLALAILLLKNGRRAD